MAMRRTPSGLLIPIRMNEEPRFDCSMCEWRGYTEQERILHIKEHIRADEDLIHEAVRSPTEEMLGEGDPEYRKYLRDRYEHLKGQVPDPLNPKRY